MCGALQTMKQSQRIFQMQMQPVTIRDLWCSAQGLLAGLKDKSPRASVPRANGRLRPVIGGSAYRTVGRVGGGSHRQESVIVEAGCEALVLSCLHYLGVGHHLAHLELISHLSARTSRSAHHAFSETRAPHPLCHSSHHGGGRTIAHHSGALPALKVWCTMKNVDILESCTPERSGLRRISLGS